jgi:hypothetical protein
LGRLFDVFLLWVDDQLMSGGLRPPHVERDLDAPHTDRYLGTNLEKLLSDAAAGGRASSVPASAMRPIAHTSAEANEANQSLSW